MRPQLDQNQRKIFRELLVVEAIQLPVVLPLTWFAGWFSYCLGGDPLCEYPTVLNIVLLSISLLPFAITTLFGRYVAHTDARWLALAVAFLGPLLLWYQLLNVLGFVILAWRN